MERREHCSEGLLESLQLSTLVGGRRGRNREQQEDKGRKEKNVNS